jgi:hypothetical protein
MKRTPLQRRSAPLRRTAPLKSKGRPKLSPTERQSAAKFKAAVAEDNCAMCGCPPWLTRMHAHHTVYRQHLARNDWWDPDNALQLCQDCHERHHTRTRPVFREALRERNLEFASRVLKAAAGTYLARYYS